MSTTSSSALTLARLLPGPLSIDPAQMHLGSAAATTRDDGASGFLTTKIGESVSAALDVDVLELIAEAWAKTDGLRASAANEHDGFAPLHVYLAKHDVVCDSRLKIALEFAGVPAVTDHLDLRLKAMFEGVGVTIENGCIVAVDDGRGAAKVELLYSSASLLSQSTEWVTLPGTWTLARPVRIGNGPSLH